MQVLFYRILKMNILFYVFEIQVSRIEGSKYRFLVYSFPKYVGLGVGS